MRAAYLTVQDVLFSVPRPLSKSPAEHATAISVYSAKRLQRVEKTSQVDNGSSKVVYKKQTADSKHIKELLASPNAQTALQLLVERQQEAAEIASKLQQPTKAQQQQHIIRLKSDAAHYQRPYDSMTYFEDPNFERRVKQMKESGRTLPVTWSQ